MAAIIYYISWICFYNMFSMGIVNSVKAASTSNATDSIIQPPTGNENDKTMHYSESTTKALPVTEKLKLNNTSIKHFSTPGPVALETTQQSNTLPPKENKTSLKNNTHSVVYLRTAIDSNNDSTALVKNMTNNTISVAKVNSPEINSSNISNSTLSPFTVNSSVADENAALPHEGGFIEINTTTTIVIPMFNKSEPLGKNRSTDVVSNVTSSMNSIQQPNFSNSSSTFVSNVSTDNVVLSNFTTSAFETTVNFTTVESTTAGSYEYNVTTSPPPTISTNTTVAKETIAGGPTGGSYMYKHNGTTDAPATSANTTGTMNNFTTSALVTTAAVSDKGSYEHNGNTSSSVISANRTGAMDNFTETGGPTEGNYEHNGTTSSPTISANRTGAMVNFTTTGGPTSYEHNGTTSSPTISANITGAMDNFTTTGGPTSYEHNGTTDAPATSANTTGTMNNFTTSALETTVAVSDKGSYEHNGTTSSPTISANRTGAMVNFTTTGGPTSYEHNGTTSSPTISANITGAMDNFPTTGGSTSYEHNGTTSSPTIRANRTGAMDNFTKTGGPTEYNAITSFPINVNATDDKLSTTPKPSTADAISSDKLTTAGNNSFNGETSPNAFPTTFNKSGVTTTSKQSTQDPTAMTTKADVYKTHVNTSREIDAAIPAKNYDTTILVLSIVIPILLIVIIICVILIRRQLSEKYSVQDAVVESQMRVVRSKSSADQELQLKAHSYYDRPSYRQESLF